ncbi:PHB depolymerase family esterase [Colwellia sp. BRX10-3]|uniref:extracellular catalytic domain type 1 short-chain-length polyhydroxyalkanoate depolymerase n=1 Tax=Colwellia sp. BRX10-3 TaxID=2759844 RepID=UPI0015F3B40B|nr:PHB depolymerase family esterase [Colwellia sp. BRX10-3]MBA6392111.1 PHB depolymerase family esterase [Colwellia sp. BRX10-3]
MSRYLSMFIITIALFSAKSFAKQSALIEFGNNPGELSASYFQGTKNNKNLIILLHGCVQQGEILAEQSGLLALANKKKFSLLIPQQSQNNNIKGCFNWFSTQDIEKNQGESLSIKNMITTVNAEHNFSKIYIIGLSAGGAMASSMVVNYPELFTAGAIIAGIPYPCADNLITAIACMRSGPSQDAEQLTTLVKQINNTQPNWPPLSIFTGSKDAVVNPKNSQQLAIHWAQLTQSSNQPIITKHQGYQVSQWQGQNKQINVELVEIENMGHGIAVAPQKNDGGSAAPFVINTPISTVLYLLEAWEI